MRLGRTTVCVVPWRTPLGSDAFLIILALRNWEGRAAIRSRLAIISGGKSFTGSPPVQIILAIFVVRGCWLFCSPKRTLRREFGHGSVKGEATQGDQFHAKGNTTFDLSSPPKCSGRLES